MLKTVILLIITSLINRSQSLLPKISLTGFLPEDATLNFTGLAVKYGVSVKEYDVMTYDGYILKLFRIPGIKPVLLMHGIFDSADAFVERGKNSLAITLADKGYDVWLGNSRGNIYSRRHKNLDPDGEEFWNFSFHEIGFYDLPAIIDFILNKTGQRKLSAIGHSQGNAIFYVLGSTRPEYNKRISVLIALAPICFLSNVNATVSTLINLVPLFNKVMIMLKQEELLGKNSASRRFIEALCTRPETGYPICLNLLNFPIVGFDPSELEPEFVPTYFSHFPIGSSRKNVNHFAQIGIRKSFSQYDYGITSNFAVYNSGEPPNYDLSKVEMRIVLIAGKNDGFSSLKDVDMLKKKLPNVFEYHILEPPRFNHLDFLLGRTSYKVLNPRILRALANYNYY